MSTAGCPRSGCPVSAVVARSTCPPCAGRWSSTSGGLVRARAARRCPSWRSSRRTHADPVPMLGIDYHDTQPGAALRSPRRPACPTPSSPTLPATGPRRPPAPHPGLPITVFVDADGTRPPSRPARCYRGRQLADLVAEVPRDAGVISDPRLARAGACRAAEAITADDLTRFMPPRTPTPRRGAVLMLFGEAQRARPAAHRAGPPHALPPGAGVLPRWRDRPRRDASRGRASRGRGGDRPATRRCRGLRRAARALAPAEQLRGDAGARLVARR